MKKVLAFVAVFSLIATSSSVFAGNVGCGFGTELMKGKSGKVFEILALTTNGTSLSSFFAVTTGTSGYKAGAAIGMNDVEIFVAKNMDSLATDIARGEGEYVNTLASMMEVSDVDNFKGKLKTNFDKIYTSTGVTSKQVVANIKDVLNS